MRSATSQALRVIALGQFSAEIPPLARRLAALNVAPLRYASLDQLPSSLDGHDILLTELDWLNALPPPQREDLARRAGKAAGWIVLADTQARFKDQVTWQRHGVNHFFHKPLNADRLAALIEDIHDRLDGPPIRVILLDDDESSLSYYSEVLRHAGIIALDTQDPLLVLEALEEFKPDLLIVDIEMPGCRGPELVTIVRQRPEYAQLPVIFLTAMEGMQDKLLARAAAAEDFLSKPVLPELLVTAVESHAWRHRALQRTTSQHRQREILERARLEQLRAAVDEHAIVSIADVKGNIIYANDRFCTVSGYSRQELLRQNHRMVKSGIHPTEFYADLWRTITAGKIWRGEVCNRHKDGTLYWVEATIVPFLDNTGKPFQYISIRTDITALKISEERFAFAVEGAGDGIWDWDIPGGGVLMSGHYETMLGFGRGEIVPNADAWVRSVHPDDLARVQQLLQDYLAGKIPAYSTELRVRCKDGTYKWVLCRGTVVARDAHGQPVRMIGIHSDITVRKQAERLVDYLKEAIETISEGFVIYDAEDRFVLANARYREFYKQSIQTFVEGLHFEDILRQGIQNGQYPAAIGQEEAWFAERLRNHRNPGKPTEQQLPDGRWLRVAEYRMADGSTAGLRSDITDLKRTEEALRTAKEAAEQANQAKSDFLSNMSHELRTPMNAIIGFAQMLEYDGALTAEQQDNVQEILKGGRHLLELINEVLDLAKIESGRIDISLEPVDLSSLVGDCQQMIQPLTEHRRISLDMAVPAGLAVRADRMRLKQVLLNLLSNAIKYNRDAGAVRLTAQPVADDRIRIGVADTGAGIAAERMAELFLPFSRLDAEHSEIEGTGIGLTITRRLVEMMGGTIGVDSEPGKGSTFWVDLPAETCALPAVGSGSDSAGLADAPTRQYRVLCVDDNPVNLKLVAQILGKRQHIRLATAHTPELGIELALADRPDLILLDINMPGMDGYQVLEIFMADARLKAIPVVAVTANAMPRDIARGKAAGFADYLAKPLDIGLFLSTIDRFLADSDHRA